MVKAREPKENKKKNLIVVVVSKIQLLFVEPVNLTSSVKNKLFVKLTMRENYVNQVIK